MSEKAKPEFKIEVQPVGDTEIKVRRQFRAPREMVFKCFTDATLLAKWLGCEMGATVKCEADTSIGGLWHHVMKMEGHGQFECFGQTLAFEAPKRLVRTYIYNIPEAVENPTTETATFSEAGGITTVEILVRHLNKASRDGQINSGMEHGAGTSFDSLEQMLKK